MMHIESIKLSPKKGGNGYTSSYSFSVGSKEVSDCGLIGKRLIKIIDEESKTISFKAKHFTVTREIIDQVIWLKEREREESNQIARKYATHIEERPNQEKLENYLLSLAIETLADLTLLMYLGRDCVVDMNTNPGEERFLSYYDNYSYIVLGVDADTLVSIITEKTPLVKYLKNGIKILSAPKGTDMDELLYVPKEDSHEEW